MNESLLDEREPIPPESKNSAKSNVETQGGDFVGRDKTTYGDEVGGDKFGGSAIKVSAERVVIYHTTDKPPSVDATDAGPASGDPPFKGLHYFDVEDADLFFGREELTAELVSNLSHNHFLAVVGASGSGKSSLVRAGLIPALQSSKPVKGNVVPPSGSERWQTVIITPTAHPLESLAAKLTQNSESVTAAATLIDDLLRDLRSLHLYARRLIESDNRLLLVVDQFEELFTLCQDPNERRAFVDNLLHAASDDGVTTVVIVLRADFYSNCAGYENLRHALERNQKYIGAMDRGGLRHAIEEPAERPGWVFETGLVDVLLRDVGASENKQPEPGALPLLSHALLETWQRRRGHILTFQGYAESGGVQGAIAKTAETVYRQGLTPEQQLIARNVFLRLTELGEGTQDTRRRVKLDELTPRGEDPDAVTTVLKKLTDARLITTSEGEVEVAHEALIREWPTLGEWLAKNRDDLRFHRRLTHVADEWIALNRDPGLLYRGALLAQAAEWATTHHDALNQREDEFLDASQQEKAIVAHNQRRWRSILAGIIGVVLILATAVIIVGVQSRLQSSEIRSRQLAGDARDNLEVDPELSIMLARAALAEAYTAEGEDALRNALQQSRILETFQFSGTSPVYVAFDLDRHRFATSDEGGAVLVRSLLTGEIINEWQVGRMVLWLAFSPLSGQLLAGADISGTVSIWDTAADRQIATLQVDPNDLALDSLAFSPDERLLATGDDGGKLRLWELATQKVLVQQDAATSPVISMAFSPDGRYLVVASYEGEISVLDPTILAVLATWKGHEGSILDVAFHPDSSLFATVGRDGRIKIWEVSNLRNGPPLYDLEGHGNTINDIAFNARGDCLATASYDHTAIVWHMSGNTVNKLVRLSAGDHILLAGEFADTNPATTHPPLDPCGTQLHTIDGDGTMQTWNIGASAEYHTIATSAHRPEAIAPSPDGQTLVTGDDDGVLLIWRDITQPPTHRAIHTGPIREVEFSPDGKQLATASWDGTAKVLDLSDDIKVALTIRVQDKSGESVALYTVAFRPPNGKQIVTGGDDGVIRLWDVTSGKLVNEWPLHGPANAVYSVAFNRDGSQFVTAGRDGMVYVWDIDHNREVHKFDNGSLASVLVAVFSPGGQSIVTGDVDGKLRFWPRDGGEPRTISAHQGPVNWIEFSPDAAMFATAGSDRRAMIWDSTTNKPLSVLKGNMKDVTDLRFLDSKDGLLLITTGFDNSVRMYLVRADDLARFAVTRVTRTWASSECNRYFDQDICL